MARECSYNDSHSPIYADTAALQARIAELEAEVAQKSAAHTVYDSPRLQQVCGTSSRHTVKNPFDQFPALFFLDYDHFKEARMTVPSPPPTVPDDIYKLLGNIDGLRRIASMFFSNVHTWLPILCRKRFELMLSNHALVPSADVALLFSVMFLLTHEASNCQSNTKTDVYWTVKNFASVLEAHGVMTPQVLQAKVFITLYELGHAIYPSAYMSLGSCVTMGKALGIDNRRDTPQLLRRFGAWAELEEIRRLWWSILLLDRYIHLGFPGHALATEDPFRNEVLPADDTQFEQAEMAGNEPLYLASPTSLRAGPFTRTCQAAHLVGRTVWALNELLQELETRFVNAIQLHRTLTAFVKVVQVDFDAEPERFATPMALAYSALIALCDPFSCTEGNRGAHTVEETDLQTACIAGIKAVSDDIVRFVQKLRPSMTTRHAAISPLVGYCLYMATITFAWRVYEGEENKLEAYNVIGDTLRLMSGRWAVGSEYLQSVDRGRELLYNTPLLQPLTCSGPQSFGS